MQEPGREQAVPLAVLEEDLRQPESTCGLSASAAGDRPDSVSGSARAIHANTARLIAISVYVTSVGWRAFQNLARVLMSGRAALAHSTQWLPTAACTRHSEHAGRPQRVQRRPASRPGWRKQVAVCGTGGWGRAMVLSRLRPSGESPVSGHSYSRHMAWDFKTEPDFQQKLDWMEGFVRDEIIPLETLAEEWRSPDGRRAFQRITDPLKDEVKRQGLWAAHLPPDMGGLGFGQVKLGLMHEILGQCLYAPSIFGNQAPDSGNAELIAVGGTQRPEGALDAAAARGQAAVLLLDDGADGRRRSDAAVDDGGARWRRVADQRAQVVLLQRIDRRLPRRDGPHGRRRDARLPVVLDVHRADRHAGGGHPA